MEIEIKKDIIVSLTDKDWNELSKAPIIKEVKRYTVTIKKSYGVRENIRNW